MSKKLDKQTIIDKYVLLARKLGKIPNKRELVRFVCSDDPVVRIWGSFENLKKFMLEYEPDLQKLEVPVRLSPLDIDDYRLGVEKLTNKKDNKRTITDMSTFDYIEQFSKTVFSGKIKPSKQHLKKTNKFLSRTHNLVLSDLHIGSDLKGDETGANDFGVIEESRRLAVVIKEAINYKPQYRDHTHLNVLLIGDIIENMMHDPRTGATLAEQSCRAIHLLSQAIAFLAAHYPKVTVYCATGNHGRNTARHHGRAIHQKFDSIETIIYFAIKASCSNLKNVEVEIPKSPLASFLVYGKRIGYTHGDTVINPGSVGTTVNVKGLEFQVNRINASLSDKDEYSVIVYGHTHIAHLVHLSNGCTLVGNGSLPPPDHFAVSIGVLESKNGQWIFESVEGHPVGDVRLISTGKEYDKDESLDEIIQPFKGF